MLLGRDALAGDEAEVNESEAVGLDKEVDDGGLSIPLKGCDNGRVDVDRV